MFRTNAIARTVWVKDLQVEKRQGPNGEYESKTILFRVASDRNYKRTVIKDGKQVEERPTDFLLCRANGALAQIIADNCSAKDGDKIISRHLYLDGHIEMYQSERSFKFENLPVAINGATYNLNVDTKQKVNDSIFVVDEMEFLDKKPTPTTQAGGVTVSGVSVTPVNVQPVAQVAPVANVAPVNVAPQPVVMSAPTIPEGYTGEGSPF